MYKSSTVVNIPLPPVIGIECSTNLNRSIVASITVSIQCLYHARDCSALISIDRLNKYSYTEIMMERIMKRCNNVFRIGRLLGSIFIKIPFFLLLRFAILFPSRLSFRKHSHRRAFLPFDSFSIPSFPPPDHLHRSCPPSFLFRIYSTLPPPPIFSLLRHRFRSRSHRY